MKHSIQNNKPEESASHWIAPDTTDRFSVASAPIEVDELDALVDAILSEFNNTDETLLPQMQEKLTNWLNTMTEKDLELVNSEKIRDFIYEMF